MEPFDIARAQNMATNGRWIVGVIALANVLQSNVVGVLMCAVPLGVAFLADAMSGTKAGSLLSLASVAATLGLFASTFFNAW
jgi:hypothetical protein